MTLHGGVTPESLSAEPNKRRERVAAGQTRQLVKREGAVSPESYRGDGGHGDERGAELQLYALVHLVRGLGLRVTARFYPGEQNKSGLHVPLNHTNFFKPSLSCSPG